MSDLKIFNGDCIEHMQTISDKTIDLILTDPPYNIGDFSNGRGRRIHSMQRNCFVQAGWDADTFEDWLLFMDSFFEQSARVVKVGGSMIVFAAHLKLQSLVKLAQTNGFYYKTVGTWYKPNPMPKNKNLHFVQSTECWIYFVYDKRTGTFNNNNKVYHDFIQLPSASNGERVHGSHPTQKPIKLMEHFVNLLSNTGDTILDPFMGSGSTGVAALRNNRSFIGVEKDEKYFQIAERRLSNVQICYSF